MTKAKHTPGPWYTHGKPTMFGQYQIRSDIYPFCNLASALKEGGIDEKGPSAEEVKANAHLIAAAPELLAELERLVLNFETDGASDSYGEVSFSRARLARVKDLITKAKGE